MVWLSVMALAARWSRPRFAPLRPRWRSGTGRPAPATGRAQHDHRKDSRRSEHRQADERPASGPWLCHRTSPICANPTDRLRSCHLRERCARSSGGQSYGLIPPVDPAEPNDVLGPVPRRSIRTRAREWIPVEAFRPARPWLTVSWRADPSPIRYHPPSAVLSRIFPRRVASQVPQG